MREPPTRQIRLLAGLAPAGGVVFALLAVWLVVSTVRGLAELGTGPGEPLLPGVLLVVLGAAAAVVTALIAYRLGIQVPRTLRAWDEALAERARALRGDAT